MRFTNLKVFEKHLSSSTLQQLGRLYLIASADDFERKQAMDVVLSRVMSPDGMAEHLLGSEASVEKILEALDSPALFGAESVVVVDEVDKKLLDALAVQFKKPISFGHLLLGTKVKAAAHFVEAGGVVLDLLDERPWEKEKRLVEQLHETAQAAGKQLVPSAASWMLEHIEKDSAALSSEMDKVLCYCAQKKTIERSDVEEICSNCRASTLWQIADDLVWNQLFRANGADVRDASFFHGLIASLRQQLMLGLKMHELAQQQVPFSEWNSHFPKVWPKTIEKKAQLANRLGVDYFRRGLNHLFEIELLSKSSSVPLDALLDFFRVRLKQ